MLSVSGLSKRLGSRVLFSNVAFNLNRGERVGLVGPNGAGKTTLLAILAGTLPPDAGAVTLAPGMRVGRLRQGFADRPVGALGDLLDDAAGGLLAAARAQDEALGALGAGDNPSTLDAYEAAALRFEALGGYPALDRIETTLAAFGLGGVPFDRRLASLSGGEKTRAGLAGLLAADADLLLLDEPTNHLDREGITWLEDHLRKRDGAALIVSHDRALLDAVCQTTLVLDDERGTVTAYAGGYSAYRDAREAEAAAYEAAWQRQQEEIARIEGDVRAIAGRASAMEAMSVNDFQRGKARRVARTAVVRKRKLERLLASEERLDKPQRRWELHPSFGDAPESGPVLLRIDGAQLDLGDRPLLDGIDLEVRAGERVALVGPNGSGKTSLLRLITGALAPAAGEVVRAPSACIGYYSQEHEGIDLDRTPLAQARAAAEGDEGTIRAYLHQYLLSGDLVLRPAAELSYGERARLALALLAIRGANLLLLDEPMNHLDIPSREQFEAAIAAAPGAVLFVTHDRYAIERLGAREVDVRVWAAR